MLERFCLGGGGTFGAAVLCRDGEPAWRWICRLSLQCQRSLLQHFLHPCPIFRVLIWLSLGSEKSCEHLTDGTEIVTAKNVAKEWDLFVWSL